MKKIVLILLMAPILLNAMGPIKGTEKASAFKVNMNLYGVWRNLDNEFVQINRDSDLDTYFMRVQGQELLAKGIILNTNEGLIEVSREYPVADSYLLAYYLSPSGETLVIQKPHSDQVWLFTRVGY